ncbi:hypothetical protein UlMin_005943 [Ulmus minor]
MVENGNEDRKWSDKKVEEEDGLRTLECLRGRLLAERQASRTAKEDAEIMVNKLIELENILKEEIKLRNKAQKKLKFLKKKLESLNLSVESEQSSSSEKCEASCNSSTSVSTSSQNDQKENGSSLITKESSPDFSETPKSKQSHETSSNVESPKSPLPEKFCENPIGKSEDSKSEDYSSADLRSSATQNETDFENYVDDSLALVPVTLPVASKTREVKPVDESVKEVLDTLRHIKEKIQSSMEIRRMVRVGPT